MGRKSSALALQSWCLRNLKENPQLIAELKGLGLGRVELCGVHADFADEASFAGVVELFKAKGMQIPSIGVQGMRGAAAEEEKFFRFARMAGAGHISVSFAPELFPDGFGYAEALAERHQVKLGIHNHGGRHWLGSAEMLEAVFKRTGPSVGLMLDTGWAMQAGEDPIAMAARFKDRLFGLHIKDFAFDRAGKPEDVVPGTGNLDLAKLFGKLREIEFQGMLVVEYEGDPANLPACVEAVSKAMGN